MPFHCFLPPLHVWCRVQKDRATKSQDAVAQLQAQCMERENQVAEFRAELEKQRLLQEKIVREKSQAVYEASSLQT